MKKFYSFFLSVLLILPSIISFAHHIFEEHKVLVLGESIGFLETELKNLKGASSCYNPSNPYEIQYVMKGGSFLCHDSYCASYRISARMGVSVGSGSDHTGFRTVATPEMLLNK